MNKSLQYLIIAFVLLLFLFFINRMQQGRYNSSSELIFNIDDDKIHRILFLDTNGDSLTILKTDTTWIMPEADTLTIKDRQISQFFEKVINGKYDMIRSKNPDNWNKYGVTDSLGKTVSIYDINNNLIKSVIFSNAGQDYSHNNYRVIGENEVYRTTENIFYLINITPNYWGSPPKVDNDTLKSALQPTPVLK
mgnify:FL=1|tara:strand:+ start:116 stop:694 length:579 start_codon:yes stop_codon:yes gene_type:complete